MLSVNKATIILAAGEGTRMRSNIAKVMHPLGGYPIIQHVLDTAKSLKSNKIISILSPTREEIHEAVRNTSEIAIQEKQLGTGDAVKSALPLLQKFDGNIVILYGDSPFISKETLDKMFETLDQGTDITILGFNTDEPGQYGRIITSKSNSNDIEAIVEYADATDKEKQITLCNSGVIALSKTLLIQLIDMIENNNAKGEFYLTDIIKIARDKNYICKYLECSEVEVMGINTQQQLAIAENHHQQTLRDQAMTEGVTMIAPETVFLSKDTKFSKGIIIEPNVVIGTEVEIGENVHIKSFTHIEKAKIFPGASIGPYARIRPGTEIEHDAKIGNFVEIKNSRIEKGAKVSHLSYIGDAHIGENTNIGAGTITCNYDGYKKHYTFIGDNVFIGSNTAIVAPVEILDGAIVAAGSTITNNIAANSLAIARTKQINKSDGAESFRKKVLKNNS